MPLYCGIYLRSNNSLICVINEKDKRLKEINEALNYGLLMRHIPS